MFARRSPWCTCESDDAQSPQTPEHLTLAVRRERTAQPPIPAANRCSARVGSHKRPVPNFRGKQSAQAHLSARNTRRPGLPSQSAVMHQRIAMFHGKRLFEPITELCSNARRESHAPMASQIRRAHQAQTCSPTTGRGDTGIQMRGRHNTSCMSNESPYHDYMASSMRSTRVKSHMMWRQRRVGISLDGYHRHPPLKPCPRHKPPRCGHH